MLAASILLALLAVALAWPVPVILARARWAPRAPALALFLWQAIALAGGLSMLGALLTFGLIPFGPTLLSGAGKFLSELFSGDHAVDAGLAYLLCDCAAVLLAAHLIFNLVLTIVSAEQQRHRHRQLVYLLASPDPERPGTHVIDSAAPVAYCLPVGLRSMTVFSAGLVALLTADELRAVVAHERAHITQRHDLLLVAFRAWHLSLPWFPIAYRAEREVEILVELLADDRARHLVPDGTLAAAIIRVAAENSAAIDSSAPLPRQGSATVATAELRVSRLLSPLPAPRRPTQLLVIALGIALIVAPAYLLVFPIYG
jgi:Zn-dependent protease with chaperone function